MIRKFLVALIPLAAIVAIAQVAGLDTHSLSVLANSNGFAAYIVDQDGRSVYFSLNDRDGQSVCSEKCLQNWTPLLASDDLVIGEGLDSSQIGQVEVSDDFVQLTYFGRPVYVVADEEVSAGTDANGTGGLWFLIGPDGERAEPIQVDEAQSPSDDSDQGKGWFTAEQSERGRSEYERSCSICHQSSLLGEQYAPALKGNAFLRNWEDGTVAHLYTFVRERMPVGSPGSLTDQQYIDVVAYILSQNGLPTGGDELSPVVEELEELAMPNVSQ